jgi:hypothetical protein
METDPFNDKAWKLYESEAIHIVHNKQNIINAIFEGCGETKVCFSIPDLCYENPDVECDQFGAVTYEESGNFTFEVLGLPNRSYASIALSFDQRMEDDSNIECVNFENQFSAYISWLIRTPLPGNDRTVVVNTKLL